MVPDLKPKYKIPLMLLVIIIFMVSGCSPAKPPVRTLQVTFSNNQCANTGEPVIAAGEVSANVEVKDQSFDIGMVVMTLDPGYGIDDLKALASTAQPPTWSHRVADVKWHGQPDGTRTASFTIDNGPIYLMCFILSPTAIIGALGPIQVTK